MFNLNHFYYFYMVAETGSVTAAAKVLHISQPALSKQLKIFEASLDTKLFEKLGRGLHMTATGLSLFGQARGIFEKANYLSREFSSTPSFAREQVRLGLGASLERTFVSKIIGEFFNSAGVKDRRNYSLTVSSLGSDALSRYLNEHVIDACITERRLSGADILPVATFSSPICLAVPAKFIDRLKGVKKKEDLRSVVAALDLPWIVPTTNLRFRQEVEIILEKHALELRPILESDSMMTIVRSVENAIGIALIPTQYCREAHNLKRIVFLNRLKSVPAITLGLWVRRVDKDRAYVKRLADAFKKSCKD